MKKTLLKSIAYVSLIAQVTIVIIFFISCFADPEYTDIIVLIKSLAIMIFSFITFWIIGLPGRKIISQERTAKETKSAKKKAKEASLEAEFADLAKEADNDFRRETLSKYLKDGSLPEYAPNLRG